MTTTISKFERSAIRSQFVLPELSRVADDTVKRMQQAVRAACEHRCVLVEIALMLATRVDPCGVANQLPRIFERPRIEGQPFYRTAPRILVFSLRDELYLRDVVTPAVDEALASKQCIVELESGIEDAIGEHDDVFFAHTSAELDVTLAYYDQALRLPRDGQPEVWRRYQHADLLERAKRYSEAADEFARVIALAPHQEDARRSYGRRVRLLEKLLPRRQTAPIARDTPSVSELPAAFIDAPMDADEMRYIVAVDALIANVSLKASQQAFGNSAWTACNAAWLYAIRGKPEARERLDRVFNDPDADVDGRARAARLLLDFVARTDPASLPDLVRRVEASTILIERSDRLRVRLDELRR